jgi:hypothetical protein
VIEIPIQHYLEFSQLGYKRICSVNPWYTPSRGEFVLFLFCVISLSWSAYSHGLELQPSVNEMKLVQLLRLSNGEFTANDKIYSIQDGVVYQVIQGKRYRPRCRDVEIEQFLPHFILPDLFEANSDQPKKAYLPLLDRLGHALRWGALKHTNLAIMLPANSGMTDHKSLSIAEQRGFSIKEYLVKRWGIVGSRLSFVRLERSNSRGLEEINEKSVSKQDGGIGIMLVGSSNNNLLEACR